MRKNKETNKQNKTTKQNKTKTNKQTKKKQTNKQTNQQTIVRRKKQTTILKKQKTEPTTTKNNHIRLFFLNHVWIRLCFFLFILFVLNHFIEVACKPHHNNSHLIKLT